MSVRFLRSVVVSLSLLAIMGSVALSSAACGGASADSNGIQVQLVTQVVANPTATSVPGVSPTPLVPPELVLSTLEVYQAGAILVSVTGDITGGTATFLGRNFKLAQGKQSMFAFVGVDTEDPTGPQPLRVDVTLANSSKATLQDTITVLPTEWTVDALDFTEEQTETLLDPTVVAEETAMLKTLYSGVTPEKLWDGLWQMPVNGGITARYGEQRSINGSAPSGHHVGTDIGADLGTPVLATNAGRVVLARQLKVHGNMIVIDHGGGLFSGYAHLSAFNVTEGQRVDQGQQIGEVGSTGLSTGAHLHWEMASQGVLLDALRFTDGTNGF
ncbi:MAG: M23 family metallopeptidase [Dehalococcoidia bacterium]